MNMVYAVAMGRGKNLDALRRLDEPILAEVVREGEQRISAQLARSIAADQRALAWAGFVITVALAALGASASLVTAHRATPIAIISGLGSVLMALSAYYAVLSVRPKKSCLPGNQPENWLPDHWEMGKPLDLKQARVEQARCLNDQIADNAEEAERAATLMHTSIDLAATTVLLAALYVAAYVAWRLTTT